MLSLVRQLPGFWRASWEILAFGGDTDGRPYQQSSLRIDPRTSGTPLLEKAVETRSAPQGPRGPGPGAGRCALVWPEVQKDKVYLSDFHLLLGSLVVVQVRLLPDPRVDVSEVRGVGNLGGFWPGETVLGSGKACFPVTSVRSALV